MANLKFNKSELVNLSYSLKREILGSNKTGAYCNTSIIGCNTRRYHGLLAVTLDRFGGDKYLLLSDVDESLIVEGKQFNLGIHCYGDVYEPRGHKYIVDFEANPIPCITCKVGDIVFKKSLLLAQDKDQVMVKYELLQAPSAVTLQLRPFLAFRNIHDLTQKNDQANTQGKEIQNGMSYCMYSNFPELNLQFSSKVKFNDIHYWNMSVVYSNEYRRGYDCKEDLYSPGNFECSLKPGESIIFSASTHEESTQGLKRKFDNFITSKRSGDNLRDQLARCADRLITDHNSHKKINAGFSWLYTGLLRETLMSVAGLTLRGLGDKDQFEEILDNLITDEPERLFHKTTQVEAPLYMAIALQQYIDYGADQAYVWKKYGNVLKQIIKSYLPGERAEVSMQPNGLLWAQMDGVALTWMNTYVGGRALTERAGFQVETNAFWYNAICFAIEMEKKYGKDKKFVEFWEGIAKLVKSSYQECFWNAQYGYLADFVGPQGQNLQIRPNQIYALWVKYSPIEDELAPSILRVIDRELVTARGIRTLSPRDADYKGVYDGTQIERDLAYYQGSTAPFLLEPYIETSFRVKGPSFWKRAEWLCEGFYEDLNKHGVGAFSELYDGDPPHEPHGAISSALSTAALLAVEDMMIKYKEDWR